jgi:hypothetical protein
MKQHQHDRFFPFEPMAGCKDIQEVGRQKNLRRHFDDTSKMVCGLNELMAAPNCIIYSIGGNNQWEFEQDLLLRTNCHIHTFDCTGPRPRFQVPQHERLHFHHKCLDAKPWVPSEPCNEESPADSMCGPHETLQQLQAGLGHERLDLLKMDIEGFEIKLLQSWWVDQRKGDSAYFYPNQLIMEVHYRAYPSMFKDLASPLVLQHTEHSQQVNNAEFATAVDYVTVQNQLLGLGYVVVSRTDNPMCKHCSELVLVRVADSLH